MTASTGSTLPLPLLARGKVREVYEVDADRLLLVASDRISAFDVVMAEPIPMKGAVLTQLSAWWFGQLGNLVSHHMISADADAILAAVPRLAGHRAAIAGRAMLCRRTRPFPVECVVRGYITGSAWKEYAASGTLAGERLPAGLAESARLDPPIFSPATKAETGHDENITIGRMREIVGAGEAAELERLARAVYTRGREIAAARGILIADTKFEWGLADGQITLVDEVLTPDSSRFWPADTYEPGHDQPSFDKQFVRNYLDTLDWDKTPPGPELPPDIVAHTRAKYVEAYERLTGKRFAAD